MEPNYHPKASNFSTVELLTKLLAVYIRFTITSLPALNWSHSSAEMHLPLPPPFQSSNPISNALLTHAPSCTCLLPVAMNTKGKLEPSGPMSQQTAPRQAETGSVGANRSQQAEREVTPRRIKLKPREVIDHPERPVAQKKNKWAKRSPFDQPDPSQPVRLVTRQISKYNNFIQAFQKAKHRDQLFFCPETFRFRGYHNSSLS
jgi:hypothetical protein